MAQDRVRGRDVKEKVWKDQVQDIVAGAEPSIDQRLGEVVGAISRVRKSINRELF